MDLLAFPLDASLRAASAFGIISKVLRSQAMVGSWWLIAPLYTEDGWTPAAVPFLQASLLFLTLVYVFETYLDLRQYQKLTETAFPQALADAIGALDVAQATKKESQTNEEASKDSEDNTSDDEAENEVPSSVSLLDTTLEKFDKSRAYGLDQSTSKFFSSAYTHVKDSGLLLLSYLPLLWSESGHALSALGLDAANEIYRSVMSFALRILQNIASDLPIELYTAFVAEARHGFNNQSLGLFFKDQVKKTLLLMAIGSPLTAGLVYLLRWGGESFYLYVWAFQCAFTVTMMFVLPVWVLPLFENYTSLEDGELRTRVEALASSLSFPLPSLLVCDSSSHSGHSGAAIFGFFSSMRIYLDDTLLAQTTHAEVLAVVAHELGHWKLSHIPKKMLAMPLHDFALAYVFGLCINNSELFASFGFARDSEKPVVVGFMLFSKAMWAPVSHVLSFVMRLVTPQTELEADAFVVDLGLGEALKSGLTKVALGNLTNLNPDPLYSKYHHDHPPLVARLPAISERMKKTL